MSRDKRLKRPSDRDALRTTLRSVRRRVGVPLAMGGFSDGDGVRLSEFDGQHGGLLRNLRVVSGAGLGGVAISTGRPAAVRDYLASESITHHYDRAVRAEGIRSAIAAPVIVRSEVRGLLYVATREGAGLGDRAMDRLVESARRLGGEMLLRDEVDRRLELILASEIEHVRSQRPEVLEEVRDLQTELRRMARLTDDTEMSDRLRDASDRLSRVRTPDRTEVSGGSRATLTPRELDVLAEVALGCRNSEIGERLSLSPETVKSYLRSATGKLSVRTRHEAVLAARRLDLLA